jgi:hypothetical protein
MADPFDPRLRQRWTELLRRHGAGDLADALSRLETRDPDAVLLAWSRDGRLSDALLRELLLARGTPRVSRRFEADAPPDGATTDGGFALLGELGRGAQGVVHVARDLVLGRKVAYKVSRRPPEHGDARRFVTEVQIVAQLDHPNIVPIHEGHRRADGRLAFSMKLIDGQTLHDHVVAAQSQPDAWPLADRLDVFVRVCEAVAYAHERGVVHRDLKPANVMVGRNGEVYVMDWGLARRFEIDADDQPEPPLAPVATTDTQVGDIVGTPSYLSPEQARGLTSEIGPASDQYALGLLLQEIVTLHPAVDAASTEQAVLRALRGLREPMTDAPPALAAVVDRAARVEPSERYPDVGAMLKDVRSFQRGDPVSVLPDRWVDVAVRWASRNRDRTAAVALAVALIGVTVVASAVTFALATSRTAAERAATVSDVARRAAEVEASLMRHGRIVESLAGSVTTLRAFAMPPEQALATPEHLVELAPDAAFAPALGGVASFEVPVFADPDVADHKLLALKEDLRRALVRSGTNGPVALDDAEALALLAVTGVPIRRIEVALDDGTWLRYPGTTEAFPATTARDEPWFQVASGRRFLHWRAVPDDDPTRAEITISRSIFGDRERQFVGVVALRLQIDAAVLGAPVGTQAWLVDRDGSVVIATAGAGAPPDLTAASGTAAVTAGVAHAPLPEVGWTYVVAP